MVNWYAITIFASFYLIGFVFLFFIIWYLVRRTYNIRILTLGVRAGGGLVLDESRAKVVKEGADSMYMKFWGFRRKNEHIPVETYEQLIATTSRFKGAIMLVKFGESDFKILDLKVLFNDVELKPADVHLKNLHVETHRRLINRHILNSFWKEYQFPILIGVFMIIFLMIEYIMFKDVNINLAGVSNQLGSFSNQLGEYVKAFGS